MSPHFLASTPEGKKQLKVFSKEKYEDIGLHQWFC
jgi:hypothetical protein